MNKALNTIIIQKDIFNRILDKKTPTFIYDKNQTVMTVKSFVDAFNRHIPSLKIFYAVKSNPYKEIIRTVVEEGHGVDVSSGHELTLVLPYNPKIILFTGPGKTNEELTFAVEHSDKVIINLDSFGELRKLHVITQSANKKIRAGVRITSSVHGTWRKFGIPLERLHEFWTEAKEYSGIELIGLQTHMSWNTSAAPFEKIFSQIGSYINSKFTTLQKREIKFIDFGGGFIPDGIEGDFDSTSLETNVLTPPTYKIEKSLSVDAFAKAIASSIKTHLGELNCEYYAEPGRIISTYTMHIALQIVDVKSKKEVIVDGGTNMIGWEKYEETYAPIINITHPSKNQEHFIIYGSLCTPHDIWGYYCYASQMKEGDILIIPNQGAYTYTLAQNFIKPYPDVIHLG